MSGDPSPGPSPQGDGEADDLPVVDLNARLTTFMGNLLVRLPAGPIQPYVTGGAGVVRAAFTKQGGALGETNSVAFMFDRVGEIVYPASVGDADTVLEAAMRPLTMV